LVVRKPISLEKDIPGRIAAAGVDQFHFGISSLTESILLLLTL
jgi:hypothetical protein